MDLRLRIEVESFQAEAKLRALNAEVQQLERQLQKGAITQQQYEATLKRISLEAGATRQQLTALKGEAEAHDQHGRHDGRATGAYRDGDALRRPGGHWRRHQEHPRLGQPPQ